MSHQWLEILRTNLKLAALAFNPDLVWTHSTTLFTAYAHSRIRTTPAVATVHGVFGDYYRAEAEQRSSGLLTNLFVMQNYHLQRYEFKNAAHLTTYSEYLKSLIQEVTPSAEVTVIPNGVNVERFRPSVDDRERVILYVGRMARIKGVHVLIRSMKWVTEKHPEWRLWLVGGAFDQPRSFFEDHMTPTTRKQIEFLGQIPNEELPALLSRAGIFVMPTLRDGFEIALMEAMASGIPCVTTGAYERTELYGGYAEAVPPGDAQSLGRCLNEVIGHYDEYTADSAVARRVSRAREFSWSKIADRYAELFRRVIE